DRNNADLWRCLAHELAQVRIPGDAEALAQAACRVSAASPNGDQLHLVGKRCDNRAIEIVRATCCADDGNADWGGHGFSYPPTTRRLRALRRRGRARFCQAAPGFQSSV